MEDIAINGELILFSALAVSISLYLSLSVLTPVIIAISPVQWIKLRTMSWEGYIQLVTMIIIADEDTLGSNRRIVTTGNANVTPERERMSK